MLPPERFIASLPADMHNFADGTLIDPNGGNFPVDATVYVVTEDEHFLTFQVEPHGPYEKTYLIGLVDAQPPLNEGALYPREVYVRGDRLVKDQTFHLDSPFPVLAQTSFKAIRILSNIEQVILGYD